MTTLFKKNKLWISTLSLIASGGLLGISTNISKIAISSGLSPLSFLTWSIGGAALLINLKRILKNQKIPRDKQYNKYYFYSALFSIVISNIIFFSAIPHVGASFVAISFTLSPLITYIFALYLNMERFSLIRIGGVFFALTGALLLANDKWTSSNTSHYWIIVTLLGPIILAIGNIYRTTHWPINLKSDQIAPGMLLVAFIILFLLNLTFPYSSIENGLNLNSFYLVSIQALVLSAQYKSLIILQKSAGPVFLSLIGSVAAVIGVPISVALLNETLTPLFLPSSVLILLGVIFMILGQVKIQNKLRL